jgi:hypothetical protein
MNIESIALNTYFGVELLPMEQPSNVARVVCAAANEVKTLFRRLEILDVIYVGGRRFVRLRSDIINPYPMLDLLFVRGRGTIAATTKNGYVAKFLNGRSGPVTNLTMHSTPKLGQRVSYKGPKFQAWSDQFR